MTGNNAAVKYAVTVFAILAVILFAAAGVYAEEPEFRIDMDSLNLQSGVSCNLTISMLNTQDAKVTEIKGLENFDVMSTGQSISTQIVNGKISMTKEINYVIMPKFAGRFTLQGVIEYDGKTYLTNQLEVNVSQGESIDTAEVQNLFVRTVLSDDEVYFGQKIVLEYELYTRYNIENFGFTENTEIDGFIINSVPRDKLTAGFTYLQGNKYAKYQAAQMYLSPVRTGTFTIPSFDFVVNVSTGGGFFSSSRPVYIQTDSRELTVKPLPLNNQPADFTGIVGTLDLESEYSGSEVEYGGSISLKVTASGNCNLDGLDKIIRGGIPGFSVYETAKNSEEGIEDGKYIAKKDFEIILVPQKAGEVEIQPIYIPYFDPETESYKRAEIPGTTITVTGDMPQSQAGGGGGSDATGRVEINQVSYSANRKGYITVNIKREHLLVGLLGLSALIVIAACTAYFLSLRKKRDTQLRNIYRQLKMTEDRNEMYNLLNAMIKHCFGISIKASPKSVVAGHLSGYGLAQPVLEVMDCIEGGSDGAGCSNSELKGKILAIYKKIGR